MKSWLSALGWAAAGLLVVAYAILAHHAASTPRPGLLEAGVFVVPLMAFALLPAWRSPHRARWLVLWLAACGALFLARDRLAASTQWLLLVQHVGINAMLCLVFGRTLTQGARPMVSLMAELVHGPLTPRLARYTRAVTWAWVGYFALTAVASVLLFAFAPNTVWSAFVNLLSLPLLGAMFAGEYLVRCLLIPRCERSGFFAAMTAYRQFQRRSAKPD